MSCRPQFASLYQHVALPGDPPEKVDLARRLISEFEGLKCPKIQTDASACHGCPDNPINGEERKQNVELLELYGEEIAHTHRLYDAANLGILRPSDVTSEEFERMRLFRQHVHFHEGRDSNRAGNARGPRDAG